ncbi:unnamed protein product [Eretmochelys imbricata]
MNYKQSRDGTTERVKERNDLPKSQNKSIQEQNSRAFGSQLHTHYFGSCRLAANILITIYCTSQYSALSSVYLSRTMRFFPLINTKSICCSAGLIFIHSASCDEVASSDFS